jgi:hypothetical protein
MPFSAPRKAAERDYTGLFTVTDKTDVKLSKKARVIESGGGSGSFDRAYLREHDWKATERPIMQFAEVVEPRFRRS